jgi:hypothetical protein
MMMIHVIYLLNFHKKHKFSIKLLPQIYNLHYNF